MLRLMVTWSMLSVIITIGLALTIALLMFGEAKTAGTVGAIELVLIVGWAGLTTFLIGQNIKL